jgi:Tfp pilus assembly protein FimV
MEAGEHLLQLKESLSKAEEEKLLLKHRVADLSCFEEITKEKNLQIEFLQNQLEQRIKHNHSLEQQEHATSEINAQLQLVMEETKKQALELQGNIQLKQHELEAAQSQLNEQLHKNEQLHLSIQLKANEITQFTSQLSELRYENTSLHESEADSNRQLIQLKDELAEAKVQAKEFEDKWEHNSRVISRIYRELSGSVEHEMSVNDTGIISGMRKDQEALSDIV